MVRIEVELDIFSGRPNPAWALATGESESLERKLAVLPRTPPCEIATRLGYRGLIVRGGEHAEKRLVRVHSGCVRIAEAGSDAYARDEGRELERWIIETERRRLPMDVVEIIEVELDLK